MLDQNPIFERTMNIHELSPHLFWDVDRNGVDLEKNAPWLVQRVLEYGLWDDWLMVEGFYGKSRIRAIVVKRRALRPKCRAFCQARYELKPEDFRCYGEIAFQKT